jgi:hypothetical protein
MHRWAAVLPEVDTPHADCCDPRFQLAFVAELRERRVAEMTSERAVTGRFIPVAECGASLTGHRGHANLTVVEEDRRVRESPWRSGPYASL